MEEETQIRLVLVGHDNFFHPSPSGSFREWRIFRAGGYIWTSARTHRLLETSLAMQASVHQALPFSEARIITPALDSSEVVLLAASATLEVCRQHFVALECSSRLDFASPDSRFHIYVSVSFTSTGLRASSSSLDIFRRSNHGPR